MKMAPQLWDGIIGYHGDDVLAGLLAFNAFGKSVVLWFQHSRELSRSSCYLMEARERKWNEITHLLQAPIALMLGAYVIETLLKMVIAGDHCDKHGIVLDSRNAKHFLPATHNLVYQ